MSTKLLALVGFITLILLAFAAGYFFRSQNCFTSSSQAQVNTAITPTVTVSPTTTPTTVAVKTPETEQIFYNGNGAAVDNGPTAPTVFTLSVSRKIYSIMDYHWNSAKGKTAGTIGLKAADGTVFGPWQSKGTPGQGGVVDAYWTVYPEITLPAGTFTIVDSDSASWAQNNGSRGIGMSQVFAVKE